MLSMQLSMELGGGDGCCHLSAELVAEREEGDDHSQEVSGCLNAQIHLQSERGEGGKRVKRDKIPGADSFICGCVIDAPGGVQYPYLLEGGSLSLRWSLGPHLQLLAQHHQLLHLRQHRRLFLINQLEQRGKVERVMPLRIRRGEVPSTHTPIALPGWIWIALLPGLFPNRVKEGWNKFRFSVVCPHPSAKARS